MSVKDIPMIIDCSKEDDKYIKLPRGTLEYLKILCDENNVLMNIKDMRNSGIRLDVRFNGILRDEQEKALKVIAADSPFEFTVLPYTIDKIENADHAHELIKDDFYTVTIDGKQRGVGGDVPAMACLKPQYKIKSNTVHRLACRILIN